MGAQANNQVEAYLEAWAGSLAALLSKLSGNRLANPTSQRGRGICPHCKGSGYGGPGLAGPAVAQFQRR